MRDKGFIMETLYIKDNLCPFCKTKLVNRIVYCPQNMNIPCLECKSCKVYLYTEKYYTLLQKLANNYGRKLNHNVYKYQEIALKDIYKKCSYFKNSICSYFDNVCNPYSIRCINRGILTLLNKKDSLKSQEGVNSNKQQKQNISQRSKYVKVVVLSHNRKCINDNHDIIDVSAKFKLLINNEITETSILAGYCKECD